jgi:hypothetical protein
VRFNEDQNYPFTISERFTRIGQWTMNN